LILTDPQHRIKKDHPTEQVLDARRCATIKGRVRNAKTSGATRKGRTGVAPGEVAPADGRGANPERPATRTLWSRSGRRLSRTFSRHYRPEKKLVPSSSNSWSPK
jgi:hypothetical protein